MGATYTRQSTFTDGDVIDSDLFNNEFDQLLAAFASSTGHTHDGTAGEGGPVTALVTDGVVFGTNTGDITLTWNAGTNDGLITWKEDEDYFEFNDDILIATTEKIQFTNTSNYIHSASAGNIDLVAATEIHLTATTINMDGAADISGNLSVGGNLDVTGTFDLSDANFTNAGNIQLDSISGDGDTDTSITFNGSNIITFANGGANQVTFSDGSIAPVNDSDINLGANALRFKDAYIDSITVTGEVAAASLDISGNIDVDGVTNLDVVDIDGAVDMASTLAVAGVLTGASLDISGDIDIDGTANLDIVDIDGAVDMASTLQVDGVATFTGRDIHSGGITIANAGQIGSVGDTDAIAIASDGVVTLTQKLVGTELDISGNVDVDGTTNLDVVDIDGAVDMASTLTVAGVLTGASLDISGDVDVDGTLEADAITLNGTALGSLYSPIAGSGSIVTTGALNSGSITSGFGTINNGSSTITTTGTVATGAITAGGDITRGGSVYKDGSITDTGDFTLDVAGDIILDADGADVIFKDGGTSFLEIDKDGNNARIKNPISDGDLLFQGNDGGSGITALTLDMSAAGAATFNNDVTAFSDERLKSNITTIPDALSKVTEMRGVHYVRNETGHASSGVIAQELQKIAPELVRTADDEMGTLSVNYANITSYLIEAVKELSAKVKELEGK